MRDPTSLIDPVRPTGVRYALAARITGVAKTAFPKAPGVVQSGNVQLVIMADSDIFDDRFWVHINDQLGRPWPSPSPTMAPSSSMRWRTSPAPTI